ncbi:FkbM family methyltransferase [Rhodopila sp.]|uniref:FkbM family methyltransferase n=1 Tax=Rhodopila sp. TaxID=2480087 RepID=UPI003D1255DB
MGPPATTVRWLPNYIKAFGAVRGLSLLWRTARLDRTNGSQPERLAVPGLGEIWLRPDVRDHAIFQQVWIKREYDLLASAPRHFPGLMETYRATLAGGGRPLVLDAGAHVGMSVLWWRHVFPEARIVAVEPSSENVEVLRRNVARLNNVTVLHAAVAGNPRALRVMHPAACGSAVRVSEKGTGESVPALTIAQILDQVDADHILLAKIDIEGGEADLFAGDLAWLDRTRALAIETHDCLYPGEGTSRSLFAAIAERPFDFLTSGENVLLFRS